MQERIDIVERLNILSLRSDYPVLCGPDIFISTAAGVIDLSRYNLMVVTLQQNKNKRNTSFFDHLIDNKIAIDNIQWNKLNPILPASLRLSRLIKKYKVHIVHTHDMWSMLIGYIGSRLGGSMVVCHAHGWHKSSFPLRGWLYDIVNRLIFRVSDKIIASSRAMKDELIRKNYPEHKVDMIPNSVDIEIFKNTFDPVTVKRKWGIESQYRVIGSVGRLSQEKGHRYLLEAMREIVADFPQVRLLIIGDGPLRTWLEGYAEELKISRYVVFTGFYEHENLPEILDILDIFVLPSLGESLPFVIMEAMAMEKPVIASYVGGVSEVVLHGETGLLVEPKCVQALTKSILSLLKEPLLSQRLGSNGKKLVSEKFSVQKSVKILESMYSQLLSANNAAVKYEKNYFDKLY